MNPYRGILFKLVAILLFTVMASCIKAAADHVPPGQAVFFRSFFALIVIVIWLTRRGDLRSGLKVQNPMGHFWRGLIGTTAMAMSFGALGLLPLPEVTAIGYATPILTVIFAAMLLGEQIRIFRLSAVAVGMVGVLIVLYPRLTIVGGANPYGPETLGAFLMLGAASFRALAQIHIRKLVQTDQTSAIVFYFSMTATLLSLLTLPFGWVVPTGGEAALLIAAGLVGGVAQIFLTTGYRHAPASTLAPFDYASMLFAIVIGYVVFDEVPTMIMLVGVSLIIAAGIFIIWRERHIGPKRDTRKSLTSQN